VRFRNTFPALIIALLFIFFISGCTFYKKQKAEKTGKESEAEKAKEATSSLSASCLKPEVNFNEKLDELEKTPMVVEIYVDRKKEGTWTQKGNNWRFEDPKGKSIAIYRGEDGIFYLIDMEEKTALKIEGSSEKYQEDYQVFKPSALIETYQDYPWTYSDNMLIAEAEDVKVVILFESSSGLINKVEIRKGSGSQVIEFKYLKVDDVPESLFQVPPGVKVFPTPS
jgi:hypothetical protein